MAALIMILTDETARELENDPVSYGDRLASSPSERQFTLCFVP